jgi:uncharacterized membrane protein
MATTTEKMMQPGAGRGADANGCVAMPTGYNDALPTTQEARSVGKWVFVAGGAAIVLAGGALLARALVGRQSGDIDHSPAAVIGHHEGVRVEKTVAIDRQPDELYRFWRNFENLPRFMTHVTSVRVDDDTRSHWTVNAPAGQTVEWDAEIINDLPNELIAWKTMHSDISNAGSVRFRLAPGGRGTEVTVNLEYDPPAGKAGQMVARAFGEEPAQQVADALRRFKHVLETGEVARHERMAKQS